MAKVILRIRRRVGNMDIEHEVELRSFDNVVWDSEDYDDRIHGGSVVALKPIVDGFFRRDNASVVEP